MLIDERIQELTEGGAKKLLLSSNTFLIFSLSETTITLAFFDGGTFISVRIFLMARTPSLMISTFSASSVN